jgi:hypothetical protein
MGTIDRSQIDELMASAGALDYGLTQIGLLEEAVRLSDLLNDIPLSYEARSRLITAANFGGAPEKAMVAFSWSLAQADRDPERFPEFEILWQYKWIISHLPRFPQLSRAQIEAALADLSQRVERSGLGMKPVYMLKYSVGSLMGDEATYHSDFALWQKTPPGQLSDCAACELASTVRYLLESGRDEESINQAGPILKGTRRCSSVPHTTLANILMPLVRLGRFEEAVAHHLKGYRLISRNRSYLYDAAEHIEFLALTDNLAKGVKLFEAHLTWALETFDLFDRFKLSIASKFLFERLLASGKKTAKLRLPATFPRFEASGKYDLAALIGWLEADAADLAARFDARNGNDSFARKIEANRRLHDLVKPFPLRSPRKGTAE